ncbi:MAG: mannose-1-phosphate guanylyltransferase [Fibrobacterota bacterium]
MRQNNIFPVIMAGGIGERFWPMSRPSSPKQLLKLFGHRSMLASTLSRVSGLSPRKNTVIVTGKRLVKSIRKEVGRGPVIISEKVGKNTAPAVAAAAAFIHGKNPDGIMAVLPADHLINDRKSFKKAVSTAVKLAKEERKLVTFGIKPLRPDTGYGYIQKGGRITKDEIPAFSVKSFREKPDSATAVKYFKSKSYLWNSGMFVWSAKMILDSFKKYMPSLYKKTVKLEKSLTGTKKDSSLYDKFYESARKESIDYGVMERSTDTAVIEAPFDWDDAGSWESLDRHFASDNKDNIIRGKAEVFDSENATVLNSTGDLLVVSGAENFTVVKTGDAVLIISKDRINDIRSIVDSLKKQRKYSKYFNK